MRPHKQPCFKFDLRSGQAKPRPVANPSISQIQTGYVVYGISLEWLVSALVYVIAVAILLLRNVKSNATVQLTVNLVLLWLEDVKKP